MLKISKVHRTAAYRLLERRRLQWRCRQCGHLSDNAYRSSCNAPVLSVRTSRWMTSSHLQAYFFTSTLSIMLLFGRNPFPSYLCMLFLAVSQDQAFTSASQYRYQKKSVNLKFFTLNFVTCIYFDLVSYDTI
jgi:hypothetical protein